MPKERYVFALTKGDIKRLKDFDREVSNKRVHDRVRIILLSQRQYNVTEIADVLEISACVVSDWIDRYEREGVMGLLDRPRSGRPSRINPRYLKLMLEAVEKSPRLCGYEQSNWSCGLLAKHLAKQTKIEVSHDWVRILLRRLGFRCGRGKLDVVSPDPAYDIKKTLRTA